MQPSKSVSVTWLHQALLQEVGAYLEKHKLDENIEELNREIEELSRVLERKRKQKEI